MIRVAIIADTLAQARGLADSLGEEERLEVVEASAWSGVNDRYTARIADVLVAAGLPVDRIPRNGPPVVVVTDGPGEEAQFRGNVRAWLPLHSSAAELTAAIFAAANDLVTMTPDQVKLWLRRTGSESSDGLFVEALTPRELQVLKMLADGLGNKEIGAQLGISEHTAKFHVAQILAKLGAGSRTEAVALGIRRGLVPI